MGRRKFRLSIQKNTERKCVSRRRVGRPAKQDLQPTSDHIITTVETDSEHLSTSEASSALDIHSSSVSTSTLSVHVSSRSPSASVYFSSPPPPPATVPSTPLELSGVASFSSSGTSSETLTSLSDGNTPSDLNIMPSIENVNLPSCATEAGSSNAISRLVTDLDLPSEDWNLNKDMSSVSIFKISSQPSSSMQPSKITHCIRVNGDLTWKLFIHGSDVDAQRCGLLLNIPSCLCQDSLKELLLLVESCNICPGHPDKKFVEMTEARKGVLLSKDRKNVTARVDDFSPVIVKGEWHLKTVRVSSCELLVDGSKCSTCVSYRNSIRSIYHRWSKRKLSSPSCRQSTRSRTNIRWLSTPEKLNRYSQLRLRLDVKTKEIKRLREMIGLLTNKNHVILDSTMHSDFKTIMNEMSEKVQQDNSEDSFKRVFWDEQLKANSVNDSRLIRWHPAIIKWCLHLKFISSGAYHALRTSGLITLPSARTLRDYAHCIRAGVGFMPEVDAQLVKEADIIEEKDRFVVLAWDEMKIKEDLVFNKHTCDLIGFTRLGEVNDILDKVEQECQTEVKSRPSNVGTHMLLFMVRGMFSRLEFPYAHFCTRGISADALFPLVWEAVQRLECCGFNVIAFCCDGASPNRKFYKMHGDSKSELVYKTTNPFCKDRQIFFICDVPHLIKTTRNCWSNSFSHKYSRGLWKDGKHISWMHLVNLYQHNGTASGMVLVKKLRRDHVYLTSYSRMRVNLAAQVLSASVAHALEYMEYHKIMSDDTMETRKFILNFDRFFDCLNVRSTKESIIERKPDLRPYRDPSDARLKWLIEGFLKYLEDWESSVNGREDFTPAEKRKMLLSAQTMEGVRITVYSFVEMAPCLLSLPGVQYILTEKLCQDPLESFFGKQRAAGGRSDNPTVQQFCDNTVSLRVQGSAALEPVRGNCGTRSCKPDATELSKPLPKRRKLAKHF